MYPIVSATSRVMQIGLTSKTLSPLELSTIAHWRIRARLLKVPGVANVAIWGEKQQQLQVLSDPRQIGKSTRLNSSHANISYAVFCLKKKKKKKKKNYKTIQNK